MDQLAHAYIVAADRAHRSKLNIHIYWATDVNSNGGYILISDLFLPQLSMEYEEFEYIDTVYPETEIEEI
jgi:hypothetical protein